MQPSQSVDAPARSKRTLLLIDHKNPVRNKRGDSGVKIVAGELDPVRIYPRCEFAGIARRRAAYRLVPALIQPACIDKRSWTLLHSADRTGIRKLGRHGCSGGTCGVKGN